MFPGSRSVPLCLYYVKPGSHDQHSTPNDAVKVLSGLLLIENDEGKVFIT